MSYLVYELNLIYLLLINFFWGEKNFLRFFWFLMYGFVIYLVVGFNYCLRGMNMNFVEV